MSDRTPRVENWSRSLLELSASHPLLHLQEGRLLIALPGADPVRVALTLAGGSAFAFEAGCDPAVEHGWLRVPLTTPELERRLTAMRRAARTELVDRGVHALWLALGALTWCAPDGTEHVAPLALWPAELERAPTGHGTTRLVAREGVEPRINQILVEKLQRDFGIVLAVPGDDDPEVSLDLLGLFDAAEGIAVTRPGWKVERTAHLGVFPLDAQLVWSDLERGVEHLLAGPVLAHLAAEERRPFAQPSIGAAEAVTRPRSTHDVLAPLDADASQLAAIGAAAEGATFVLHAAPGTGGSQTIANLIAHCISSGKTVLCVSDQLRGLDVVHQRLSQVGLGEFCLPIAAPESTRAAIVAQLGRVFERAFRPGTGPSGDDARLVELRGALDTYVTALHKIGPFGRSVHDVLGRLVELRTTPRADLAERDAIGLDRATFERRRAAVTRLAAAAIPVEPVATHPWRASTLDQLPDGGQDAALGALDEAGAAVSGLGDAVRDLAAVVPGIASWTRDQLLALGALGALAAASPRPGAEMLTNIKAGGRAADVGEAIALIRARGTGSVETPRDPLAFLQLAHRHRALATEVEDVFTDAVEQLDAAALWAQLRKWTSSMGPLRFVALRNARAEIRAAAMPAQLDTDGAMITALEAVMAERACRTALLGAAEPAKRWFGELGGDPLALDLAALDAAVGWAAELRKAFDAVELVDGQRETVRAAAWRALVAQVAAGPAASAMDLAPFARLAAAVARWVPALANLATTIGIDAGTLGAGDDHLVALRERIDVLRHAVGSLADWVAFHAARHAALAGGIGPAVGAIERGDLGAAELALAWERATLLAWGDAELTETPALAQFHGASHHAQVAAFADLDRGALALSRARALVRIADRVPRVLGKLDPASTDPMTIELGVLMQELKKQRAHRPLRALFAELPTLLPRLAPCVLATPQAIAQHLDPALARFDVVVIDDAGRLPAAVAIGALGRANAAVVVGDARRLGPADSLLDECIAARLPELSLAWHYRSKHEDVIAFANERFYADRLQVFPAAQSSPDHGVAWRRIDGTFDRDGAGTNRLEAEAVVAEVVARLRDPIQRLRSIGIVTCSLAQQELVEDLLDAALLGEPAAALSAAAEPIVVKDIASLAGDDRDVVLLSIGYGPGLDGVMTMNLGPLSAATGPRALATALTRAREQLVVFSSFAPEDLHDDAAPAVRDLAAFLAFARASGGAARPGAGVEAEPASPITAAIARALADRGWHVRHQVGCGAYKLDLAVVDPSDPDRYVLAIELDGAAYASATVARDRDRLRAQVLGQLGWRLHRIWGLDWWAEPDREIQRAHGAIVTAIAASRQRRAPAPMVAAKPRSTRSSGQLVAASVGSQPVVKIPPLGEPVLAAGSGPTEATPLAAYDGATTPTRIPKGTIAIGPYTAAAIPNGRRTPDDLFAPRHLAELGKVVEQVLAAEAPMHVDLLARRVGGYFGIGRVTQRVTDQVKVALSGRGRWGEEQDVVWRLDQDPEGVPSVRVAGQGPTAKRAITEVPLSELASAARIVVERANGIAPNDLVRDAARLLGFARITEEVVGRVTLAVRLAAARELIRIENGKAQLPPMS